MPSNDDEKLHPALDTVQEISYRETKHFLITRDFLNSPESFFKHLFGTVDDNGGDA